MGEAVGVVIEKKELNTRELTAADQVRVMGWGTGQGRVARDELKKRDFRRPTIGSNSNRLHAGIYAETAIQKQAEVCTSQLEMPQTDD